MVAHQREQAQAAAQQQICETLAMYGLHQQAMASAYGPYAGAAGMMPPYMTGMAPAPPSAAGAASSQQAAAAAAQQQQQHSPTLAPHQSSTLLKNATAAMAAAANSYPPLSAMLHMGGGGGGAGGYPLLQPPPMAGPPGGSMPQTAGSMYSNGQALMGSAGNNPYQQLSGLMGMNPEPLTASQAFQQQQSRNANALAAAAYLQYLNAYAHVPGAHGSSSYGAMGGNGFPGCVGGGGAWGPGLLPPPPAPPVSGGGHVMSEPMITSLPGLPL